MSDNSANSKRIAKNTLMLYFRMLLIMGTTLYTSRVVLAALGVEDYGIYNVVGGVVAMFTMISGSLSSAISRFITFELGKGNQKRLNTIFSTSVIIQIVLAIIITILLETIGVWFLNNKMVIPPDRLYASQWVLQFSLITLIINLISIPYNAAIIAHEKMSAFAYISILQALGQLSIAFLIKYSPIDSLIFYSILMCLIALFVRLAYGIYCKRNFEECNQFSFFFDKSTFKEMFSFAGWNFIGTSSQLLRDQGGNILLNLFGGPTVNAAMGVSNQVKSAILQFSNNFMIAINPQITKSYASGNYNYLMDLVFQGSRFSFYLLFTISLPIIICTPYILGIWLETVPDYTVIFVRLSLIFGMIESISQPLITAQLATGKIKKYQLIVGGLQMMNFPIAYIFLSLGALPQVILIIGIVISLCCFSARLYLLRKMIKLRVREFLYRVFLNVIVVSILASLLPLLLLSQNFNYNFLSFLSLIFVTVLYSLTIIYLVGCTKYERSLVNNKIRSFF